MSVRRRSRASSRLSHSNHEVEVPTDPNTFSWPERSRKKFVQLVALQCLVTPAPITTEHPVALEEAPAAAAAAGRHHRRLPPKTEREIADHFAFLAAGDGSGAACCIEEVVREGQKKEEGGVGLRFRIAMNEGVPREVLEGLRGVVREVGRRADEDHTDSDIKSTVWAHVLDLEKAKVHADLVDRFTRGTRPLSDHFSEALGHCDLGPGSHPTDDVLPVLQKIYDLCIRVTSTDLSQSQCTRDLDRLLDTCYRFRSSRSFKSGLKAAASRRQIVQMVEKLGRYRTASNALVAAARKFPDLFSGAAVDAVPALPALEDRVAAGFKGVYVGDVARDLTSSNTETICMSRLRTITDLSNEKLASKFQDLCQSAPTAHAEIQLVKFYEENAHIDRPSFIGCSKKSCFLCGLFLQLQRRFTVSKAHQNIYHAWTVPTIRCASPENAVMLEFVVEKMSRIIEDSCKKMLWEKKSEESSSSSSSSHRALIATLPPPVSNTPVNTITASTSSSTTIPAAAPPPSSSGFITPGSPLSPISPYFSRPSTAASNFQIIRASSSRQTPKPQQEQQEEHHHHQAPSKLTDSSGESSSPEPSSPHLLSSESSCTSVSEDSSKESIIKVASPPKRQSRSNINSSSSNGKHMVDTAAHVVAAAVERMPAITAADAPSLPQRSPSRVRESSNTTPTTTRPGSVRSTRKRGSPVEVIPKAEQQKNQQQQAVNTSASTTTTTITRSQSVRVSRRSAPASSAPPVTTPKATPMRSASVARRPAAAAPEIPARRGHVRSASAMEVRKITAAQSDTESISPRTISKPFGPLRRSNTSPIDATTTTSNSKSAIPVPRSVSRSNRKATSPRSPSAVRYIRLENPVHHETEERPPSPGHITASLLRRESPISVARFETAMAMAVTSVTGSPTMVELRGSSSSSEAGGSARGSPNVPQSARHPSRSRAQKRMSPLSVERKADDAVETEDSGSSAVPVAAQVVAPPVVVAVQAAAGLGLKKSSSKISLRESFTSSEAVINQVPTSSSPPPLSIIIPSSPLLHPTDREDSSSSPSSPHPITVATPHGISIIDSSEESAHPLPTPKRTLTERRGRALKRVDPPPTPSKLPRAAAAAADRKRAAIDRATADFVQETGLTAQRKRGGMTIADVVQASGFQAQLSRGIPPAHQKPYHSDTEMAVRARLRGGALSTISSSSEAFTGTGTGTGSGSLLQQQRIRQKRRMQETEYTLYLAGPDHDDRTLGEKIFSGRLSDGSNGNSAGAGAGGGVVGGEVKQRAGCKVRTALRPAEREISGMRVKEVVKSLEEMVLDIFFPDAVLRLEVMWDGSSASTSTGAGAKAEMA